MKNKMGTKIVAFKEDKLQPKRKTYNRKKQKWNKVRAEQKQNIERKWHEVH